MNPYAAIAARIMADNPDMKVRFWNRYQGRYSYDTKTATVPHIRGEVSLKVLAHELSHHRRGMIRPIWRGELVADLDAFRTLAQYGYIVDRPAIHRAWRYHVQKLVQALRRGYRGPVPAFLRADVARALAVGTPAWWREIRRAAPPIAAYLGAAAEE